MAAHPTHLATRHLLTAPHGILAVRDTGPHRHAGPPLLAVHGWGADALSNYHPVLRDPPCRVVAVDLPGHGDSDPLPKFSLLACAQLLGFVCERLELDSPVLAGYSMGGPVTQIAACTGLVQSSGLVQIATAARLTPAPFTLRPASLLRSAALLTEFSITAARGLWLPALHRMGLNSSHFLALAARTDLQTLRAAARELTRYDGRVDLHPRTAPCVSVITTRDLAVPPRAQRELADLLDAQRIEVRSGHALCFEPAFAPALRAALDALDRTRC